MSLGILLLVSGLAHWSVAGLAFAIAGQAADHSSARIGPTICSAVALVALGAMCLVTAGQVWP